MSKKVASAEEDIVASGEALRTVAGWLGVADVDEVMENEGLNLEFEMGRTQGLGLGAKFLPRHKVAALTSGVEQRLGSKLKWSAERRMVDEAWDGQDSQPAGRRSFGARHSPGQGCWHDKAAAGGQQQVRQAATAAAGVQEARGSGGADDSEEEGGGRGGAFGKGAAAANKPATFIRSDLLRVSGVQQGKKRKRKGGQGAPPPAGT